MFPYATKRAPEVVAPLAAGAASDLSSLGAHEISGVVS